LIANDVVLGRQLYTFNNIAHVQVGAKRDVMGRLLRSFTGTIAGEYYHYLRHSVILAE